jgi:hypothetical protein
VTNTIKRPPDFPPYLTPYRVKQLRETLPHNEDLSDEDVVVISMHRENAIPCPFEVGEVQALLGTVCATPFHNRPRAEYDDAPMVSEWIRFDFEGKGWYGLLRGVRIRAGNPIGGVFHIKKTYRNNPDLVEIAFE